MASEREQDCNDYTENDVLKERIVDDLTQSQGNMDLDEVRVTKRQREHNNEEIWYTVSRNSKKKASKQQENRSDYLPIQICVTSKEKLPKQFALAKLLQQNEIGEVNKVKYVNPYKLLITFENELSAEKFLSCPEFDNFNWRRQKTWEVGLSYGIIRDIDLDMSEEELLKYIISENDILSLKRLNRKVDEGWTLSETIRIGFKGSSLPSYIYLFDIKIKVEPYVFPVTQCAKCWRYGHSQKLCPASKAICPKCGSNNHSNCLVKVYKCINCSGGHMALSKNCPIYKKEKRIRELMSEFNCTYQKALLTYVPPSPRSNLIRSIPDNESFVYMPRESVYEPMNSTPSYADVTQRNLQPDSDDTTSIQKNGEQHISRKKKKKKKKSSYHLSENVVAELEVTSSENSSGQQNDIPASGSSNPAPPSNCHQNNSSTFTELLQKLKNIIVDKENGLVATLKAWFKIVVDYIKNLIPKFSNISNIFTLFNG